MKLTRAGAWFCLALFAGCGGESAAFEPTETGRTDTAETTGGESAPPAAAAADQQNEAPSANPATDSPSQPPAAAGASSENPSPGVTAPEAEAKPQADAAPATPGKPEKAAANPKPSAPPAKPASGAPSAGTSTAAPAATPATSQPALPAQAGAGAAAAAAPAAQTPPPSAAARVVVELRGLKSDSGKIQAALFRTETGFPKEPNKAAFRKVVQIHDKAVDLWFDVDPPGTFCVLVHHDENGDSKMQTGMLGQPAEGWGATRDPSANFGPPSFDDAKLTIKAGETKHVAIKMRY